MQQQRPKHFSISSLLTTSNNLCSFLSKMQPLPVMVENCFPPNLWVCLRILGCAGCPSSSHGVLRTDISRWSGSESGRAVTPAHQLYAIPGACYIYAAESLWSGPTMSLPRPVGHKITLIFVLPARGPLSVFPMKPH